MNQSVTHVVILAAGQGTRMKSHLPKVLHAVAGRPMLEHVLDTAAAVAPATVTVIVGHGGDKVRQRLAGRPGVAFAVQEPQLGTAHALQQAEPILAGRSEEHTSELQSQSNLVCRLLLEKKKET